MSRFTYQNCNVIRNMLKGNSKMCETYLVPFEYFRIEVVRLCKIQMVQDVLGVVVV